MKDGGCWLWKDRKTPIAEFLWLCVGTSQMGGGKTSGELGNLAEWEKYEQLVMPGW